MVGLTAECLNPINVKAKVMQRFTLCLRRSFSHVGQITSLPHLQPSAAGRRRCRCTLVWLGNRQFTICQRMVSNLEGIYIYILLNIYYVKQKIVNQIENTPGSSGRTTHARIYIRTQGRITQKGGAGYGWIHVCTYIYRCIIHEIIDIFKYVLVYVVQCN